MYSWNFLSIFFNPRHSKEIAIFINQRVKLIFIIPVFIDFYIIYSVIKPDITCNNSDITTEGINIYALSLFSVLVDNLKV